MVSPGDPLALGPIVNDVVASHKKWVSRSYNEGLEDARNVLTVLTARLSPTSPVYGYSPVILLHMFLTANMQWGLDPGTEDLFLPLLQAIYDQLWLSFTSEGLHTRPYMSSGDVGIITGIVS